MRRCKTLFGLCMIILIVMTAGCTIDNCMTGAVVVTACHDEGKVFYSVENQGDIVKGLKIRVEADYDVTAIVDAYIREDGTFNGDIDLSKQGIKGFKSMDIMPMRGYKVCTGEGTHIELNQC